MAESEQSCVRASESRVQVRECILMAAEQDHDNGTNHPLFTSLVIHWWRATHSFTLSGYTFDHRKPGSFLNLIMQSAPGLDLGNSWYKSLENTFGYKASQSGMGVVIRRMWHGVSGYCFFFSCIGQSSYACHSS